MRTHTCTDCHTPIPAGEAVIRSFSLQRVTFHRDCWEARTVIREVSQRVLVGSVSAA